MLNGGRRAFYPLSFQLYILLFFRYASVQFIWFVLVFICVYVLIYVFILVFVEKIGSCTNHV